MSETTTTAPSVSDALAKIELIDLKIAELKRQTSIVSFDFKKAQRAEGVDRPDLRKCEEWNNLNKSVSDLVKTKRSIIMDTEIV